MSEIKRHLITEWSYRRFEREFCKKRTVWGKITFPRSDLSWSNSSFALTEFPDRPLLASGQGKNITKAVPTTSLSDCSKDTVHTRSWTPESRANLPCLSAESNLQLMCSNGTPANERRAERGNWPMTDTTKELWRTQGKNVRKVTVTSGCQIEKPLTRAKESCWNLSFLVTILYF